MRRRMILIATGLLVVLTLGALESQRIITGWVRGEAFYRWRPTSYWRSEMTYWRRYRVGDFNDEEWRREPPTWRKPFEDLIGIKPSAGYPFNDLGCYDVVRELSKDPGGAKGPARLMWQQLHHAFPEKD